jgi:hypothetical protein
LGIRKKKTTEVYSVLASYFQASSGTYDSCLLQGKTLFIQLGGSKFYAIYIITFIAAMLIIYTFRLKLLYGNYFILIFALAWIIPTSNFPLCLLIISLLLLLDGQAYMVFYGLLSEITFC